MVGSCPMRGLIFEHRRTCKARENQGRDKMRMEELRWFPSLKVSRVRPQIPELGYAKLLPFQIVT